MPVAPPLDTPRFVRGAILVGYESLARTCGLDAAAMLARAGLTLADARQPERRLRAWHLFRLLELSAGASGRSDFGLLLPEGRRLSYLGGLGLRMREQPTVRSALRDMAAHISLHSTCLDLRLEEGPGWAEVRMVMHADGETAIRQGTEAALAGLLHLLRMFLGSTWRPPRALFIHEPPADAATHRWLFACPLTFSAPWNAVGLRPADLNREIPLSDAGFIGLARAVPGVQAGVDEGARDALRVRHAMLAALPGGGCHAGSVAADLGVHRRTLHRMLAREGQTFRGMLLQLRRELAMQYLAGRMPLAEAASWLGFGDATAFSRWCRHQWDASPRELRAAAGKAAGR